MTQHQATATLIDGMHFTVDTGDGVAPLHIDSDAGVGGRDLGARPIKLLLSAVAGCTGMDVISILRKKRQDVTDFQVSVTGDQHTADHPYVYTRMTVTYTITGRGIDPAAVERAIELSETRYCPSINLLKQVIPIESRYEIIEAGEPAPA